MKFCQNCGNQMEDTAAVCTACGTPANGVAQAAPAAPVAPQPQYYAAPQMPYAVPKIPGKGMGIASMVLGIICLALFCIPYIALPCAIIACALGGAGLAKSKKCGAKNGVAVAGLVCSIIALAVAIVLLAAGADILNEIF